MRVEVTGERSFRSVVRTSFPAGDAGVFIAVHVDGEWWLDHMGKTPARGVERPMREDGPGRAVLEAGEPPPAAVPAAGRRQICSCWVSVLA